MLLWKIEVGGGYLMISYHLLVDKLCVEWLLKNTICFANHTKGLFVKERKHYNSFITCYLQRFSNNPKLKWYLLFFSKSKIQKNHLFTDWKFKFWYLLKDKIKTNEMIRIPLPWKTTSFSNSLWTPIRSDREEE